MKKTRFTKIAAAAPMGLLCYGSIFASNAKAQTAEIAVSHTHDLYCKTCTVLCVGTGGDCQYTVWCGVQIALDPTGKYWEVSGAVDSMYGYDPSDSLNGAYSSQDNFTFPDTTTMNIKSTDFPGVPAMIIDMSGQTTDSNGNFDFLAPKQN